MVVDEDGVVRVPAEGTALAGISSVVDVVGALGSDRVVGRARKKIEQSNDCLSIINISILPSSAQTVICALDSSSLDGGEEGTRGTGSSGTTRPNILPPAGTGLGPVLCVLGPWLNGLGPVLCVLGPWLNGLPLLDLWGVLDGECQGLVLLLDGSGHAVVVLDWGGGVHQLDILQGDHQVPGSGTDAHSGKSEDG